MKKLQNFINGKVVDSASGETTTLINPSTGQAFATAPNSNAADIDKAMKAASDAFPIWRDSTPSERQRALLKIADAIEARGQEFVDIESEPNTEFLTSPQGQFNFKTQSGAVPNGLPATNQNGGGIVLRIVKQKVKFTWYFVPYEIVFAENVVSGFGKVNQYDFFGYPKGSLLLEGIESKRYPPPEVLFKVDPASGSSVAQKLCDVTFVFSCFMQPYRDLSADIPASTGFKITYGHNLLPRAGELKYYYVQTKNPTNPALDGRPVYESYPMERLFKLD